MAAKDVKIGETGGISVIDFGPFMDGSCKQQVADAIVQSFKDIGFVYLLNHGLSQETVDVMFGWVSSVLHSSTLIYTLTLVHSLSNSLTNLLMSNYLPLIPRMAHTIGVHDPLSTLYNVSVCLTGYSAPGVEKVVKDVFDADELKKRRAQAQDVKESFECGREDDDMMPNIWLPDGVLPGFKEACLDFYWVIYSPKVVALMRTDWHYHARLVAK